MTNTSIIGNLKARLSKTRESFLGGIKRIVSKYSKIDDDIFEDLEELLIEADVGVETTLAIIEDMRATAKKQNLQDPQALYNVLKEELKQLILPGEHTLDWKANDGPHVTLIAGVNGSGKTTTCGKLAARLIQNDKKVLLGAADTFRAAAVEQLTIWSQRTGAEIVKHGEGADPASVAFDATDAAIARNVDNLLIDTAGRLHTKVNLMEEIRKIQRVIKKRIPEAPHEVLLVLDATTGQNGLQQARQFAAAIQVTGIVLTKLDGTAKGGMTIAIQKELGIPIKFIGVGEGIDDLQPFDPSAFIEALFEQ